MSIREAEAETLSNPKKEKMLQVRVTPEFLEKLDAYCKAQPGQPPTRQEVVRQVVERFLDIEAAIKKP